MSDDEGKNYDDADVDADDDEVHEDDARKKNAHRARKQASRSNDGQPIRRSNVNRNSPAVQGIIEALKLGLLAAILIGLILQLFQQRALTVAMNAHLDIAANLTRASDFVVLSADRLDAAVTRLESSSVAPRSHVPMYARRCLEQYVDMSSAFATPATEFVAFAERHMNRSLELQRTAAGLIIDWSADSRVGATIAAHINQGLRMSVTTLQASINDREAVSKELANMVNRQQSQLQQVIDCVSFGP